jgi:hypothetical protein
VSELWRKDGVRGSIMAIVAKNGKRYTSLRYPPKGPPLCRDIDPGYSLGASLFYMAGRYQILPNYTLIIR